MAFLSSHGKPITQVELLGVGKLKWEVHGDHVEVVISSTVRRNKMLRYAATFKLNH